MSLYQHWTDLMYLKNARSFMDSIKLPEDLKDEDNSLKLLAIIFPCTVKRIQPSDIID